MRTLKPGWMQRKRPADAAQSRRCRRPTTGRGRRPYRSRSDNSFNPAIGVTFQGQAWAYDNDPEDYSIPGFPLGGEAGPAPEGLSLAETEITMSANVDDKFTAMLTVPIVIEDGEVVGELEEAWVETLGLPGGLAHPDGPLLLCYWLPQRQAFSLLGFRRPATRLPGIPGQPVHR